MTKGMLALAGGAALVTVLSGAASAQSQSIPPEGNTADASPATDEAASSSGQLADIVVTAQKRSESVQKVPFTVTSVSAETLQERGIFDSSQLPFLVPSVQQTTVNNQVGATNFAIRGIGTAVYGVQIESSVGTVIDGVAMSRPQFGVVQFFDLDRVEVLEGPQGMLFGKNASAGLINIVTNDPSFTETKLIAHASLGNMSSGSSGTQAVLQTALNLPLTGNSALRISAFGTYNDGFVKNVTNRDEFLGQVEGGVRVKYLWEPDNHLSILLGGDYTHEYGPGSSIYTHRINAPGGFIEALDTAVGITASPNNLRMASGAPNSNVFDVGGVQANVAYTFDSGISITNIAAFRQYSDDSELDADMLPANLLDIDNQGRDYTQYSNELRVASAGGARFDWQVGFYYLNLKADSYNLIFGDVGGVFGAAPPGFFVFGTALDMRYTNTSYAGFGQATFALTPSLKLTAGVRYTDDDMFYSDTVSGSSRGFSAVIPSNVPGVYAARAHAKNWSYRGMIEYDVAPDIHAYFLHARGYKGPTFDQVYPNQVPVVDPEIPIDFEIGVKAGLLNRKLILNVAAFHERFRGFQNQAARSDQLAAVVQNAGTLVSKGFQAQFRALPTTGLTLSGSVIYNKATYGSFVGDACYYGQPEGPAGTPDVCTGGVSDSSGNSLAGAPRWSGNAAVDYERPINDRWTGSFAVTYNYRSSLFFTSNEDPRTRVGALGLVGGNISMKTANDRWKVSVFARNIFDKRFPAFIRADPLSGLVGDTARGGNYWNQFDQGSFRTIGLSLDLRL